MAKAPRLFVGRERETEELLGGLEGAIAGHGRLFLIEGEPGVGKTALAEEFAARARQRRATVLWSRCWQGSGAPPYWPWIQLVRSCVKKGAGGDFLSFAKPALSDIAETLPDALEFPVEHAALPVPADPEQARFRLFDAVRVLLRAASGIRPLVLVLDDLSAADRPSLLLLSFIARELHDCRILLAATCRDAEVRASPVLLEAMNELARDASRIKLEGLSLEEVGLLIEKQVHEPSDSDVVKAIHSATGGNAFFVQTVIRTLPDAAFARLEDWQNLAQSKLPKGLAAAMRSHLAPLSNCARNLLLVAAVSGREFDAAVLERVTDLPREQLFDAIAEATTAGLIAESGDLRGRFRFVHSLIRDTLYERLQPAARARIHQRIGEAIEDLHGPNSDAHLVELAHHFFESAKTGSPERALEYARRAAERATALSAFEEAARCYQMALAVSKFGVRMDERERCELLLAMGEAQNHGADYAASRDTFRMAAELAERLGEREMLAQAALGYPGLYWDAPSTANEESIRLLERALKAFGNEDDAWRAMLMARLASELYYRPAARQRREGLSRQAVDIARRIDDKHALLAVLGHRDLTLSGPDTLEERLENAEQMTQTAEQTGSYLGLYLGFLSRTIYFRHRGDIDKAEAEAEAMALVARVTELPVCSWGAQCFAASRALAEGRFERGEQLGRECLKFAERMRPSEAQDLFWPAVMTAFTEQGRLGEIEPMAAQAVEQRPGSMVYRALLALINLRLGRTRKARADFEFLAGRRFADIPRDNTFLACASALAEVCVELRDGRRGAQLFEIVAPYAELNVVFGPLGTRGSLARYVGMLAACAARFQEAEEYFEAAVAFNERIKARPYVAYTQADYATMLLERGSQRDLARAQELLRSAGEIAEAIGMKTLAGKVAQLVAKAESLRHAAPALTEAPWASAGDAAASDPAPQSHGTRPTAHANRSAGSEAAVSVTETSSRDTGRIEALFRRDGDYWTVIFEGQTLRLKHVKGLTCLAYLLGHPAMEIHAAQLAAVMNHHRHGAPGVDTEALANPGVLGDAGPMLDDRAKTAYKRRLAELHEQLEEAKESGDIEGATRAEEEIDALAAELSRAVGLGGRNRRAASSAERARLNVTKAIKAVLARIAEHDGGLAGYLKATVRTGTFCSYKPDPRSPIFWRFG